MSHKQVQPAIVIDICSVSSHSCFQGSILAETYSGGISLVTKGTITFIDEEKVAPCIVGHKNICPTIVVEVCQYYTQSFPRSDSYSRRLCHVRKGSVPVVMVKRILVSWIIVGVAISPAPWVPLSAKLIRFWRPLDIVANEQVKVAIMVVFKPTSTVAEL